VCAASIGQNSSVLQCDAVCCSVMQCVAVCCSVLQCVAVFGSATVWCRAGYAECVAVESMRCLYRWTFQWVAVCCNVRHWAAVCCVVGKGGEDP